MPRVSVVMPAYNAARHIGGAVASVLSQTYRDYELVVVDDGSSDETGAIVAAHPGPVKLLGQENAGVGAARNAGIAGSSGDLITFCDADDFLFPSHLGALVSAYDDRPGIVTANAYWLFPDGIHPSKTRHKGRFPAPGSQRRAILEQNFVSTMSLFPASLVDDIGPFADDLRRAEDWEFWMRAIFAGVRVSWQRRPYALYRWEAASLSADRGAMDLAILDVLRRAESTLDLTIAERALVRHRLEGPDPRQLGRDADDALRAARYGEAARLYLQAAKLTPSERRLVMKARLLRVSPRLLGPVVRARQLRLERQLGFTPDHVR
jgi:glycosyltransferase involved in cell wall biosynthesis